MGSASPQEPEKDMEGYYNLLQAGSKLENTLQQVTVPVSMQEVAGYIEKQVAYLSGGCGEDSSVIITLPECSAFSDIPEEALAKVLSYLTLIPRTRQPGVKFIIILDRRLDTWASIKTALARIAAIESFAVMVKDIAQMLQAFGTELAETQLSEECSAIEFLLLSHTEKYRRLKDAIRSVMREGRQLLSNLETSRKEGDADTCWDMTQDWDTMQRLLAQLTDMEMAFDGFFDKHHLKLQQYLQLLRYEHSFQEMEYSLEKLRAQERKISITGESLSQTDQSVRELDSLKKHAQEEMSRAQVLILHGHQLAAGLHYAMALIIQRCNELRHQCDTLTSALNTKHNSLIQAQTLLHCLEEAQRWCDDGAYLLANQQVDKFQSKEGAQAALRGIEKFQEAAPLLLGAGEDVLFLEYESVLTPCLQAHIEKTFQKHSSVQALIQSRRNCLRKLANKHVRPIQLVAPRPENPPRAKSPLFSPKHDLNSSLKFTFDLPLPGKRTSRKSPNSRKIEVIHDYQTASSLPYSIDGEDGTDLLKRHVMKELIETERIYVEELLAVLLGYRAEMDNPSLAPLLPTSLRNKRDVLFGNLPDIYNFHSSVFLQDLESCMESPEAVGACFLERKDHFHLYECYCQNKPRSDSLWRQFSDCLFFQECQKKLEHKLALDSYLLKPVQRLTKYQLLLKELLKYSSGCERVSELQGALEAMLDLLKSVNDSMHQIAITGYEGDLSNLGRVLMQGSFSVWISHKKGPTRVKELARFKPMQRHLFLHEHALLFCKRREEHGENADKTPSYSFKHCLKMSAVGITENVKGDVKKFEIWYSGREEVYVIQSPTVEVKIAWLNEIRKILTNQQKQLKEGLCHSAAVSEQMQMSPPLSVSKQQRASVSSEGTESSHSSPDPFSCSTQHQHNRCSWPGTPYSVGICEGLEDWSGANSLSNPSDTEEEEEAARLVAGRYRAFVEWRKNGTDNFIIKCGDVIQLQHEENDGHWLVKNLSRRQEGRIPTANLQGMLGESLKNHSNRLGDPGNRKARKLSSP
ncbi:guanine nucleotide exchange factor DBS-like [Sinocyclocheilus rhinocerous]|uniref:guanine nucleotide exchange factor DBS-like n=1 Tax=Sinocyclocheilus rhinocerous TaxID=307959 RepID=UPI0007B7FF08|nr:PREDICTED: guanine nucleotide exchange factor DBS-like [Sinocyclocheilus rhinocerous]